ncbi:MAG: peptidase T [Oscillospiraceae bacterium]|nr:peptidase T [Oscillospiraceae bacterium]
MKALERFLKYIAIPTASDEKSTVTPSTACQFDLSRHLAEEMIAMGLSDVSVDEHAYVYGFIPASPGLEEKKAIGLIAHLDTVAGFEEKPVNYQIIEHYDGGPIRLGESGKVIEPSRFPHLKRKVGKTIVTTDGTTVLGADDKAGIAAILTACEQLLASGKAHGKICVCFTPDEEIGHGASLLDLKRFGADYAYTVDGGGPEDMEYETFNAAGAKWEITGFEVHPGSAKDTMINASLVAMEINSMLPAGQTPRDTSGREGFFHLCAISGDVSRTVMEYIIRDHDPKLFELKKQQMKSIAHQINCKYGDGTARLTLTDQYQNMAEIVCRYPEILDIARQAISDVGLTPQSHPVRGGTDGAQLSFRGLPCPNLGAGGYSFHGPYEHLVAEELDQSVQVLLNVIEAFSKR